MGSFSIVHWLIVLAVVVLVFGTKKLRNLGEDLGGAVKGFKQGIKDGGDAASKEVAAPADKLDGKTIDAEAREKNKA